MLGMLTPTPCYVVLDKSQIENVTSFKVTITRTILLVGKPRNVPSVLPTFGGPTVPQSELSTTNSRVTLTNMMLWVTRLNCEIGSIQCTILLLVLKHPLNEVP